MLAGTGSGSCPSIPSVYTIRAIAYYIHRKAMMGIELAVEATGLEKSYGRLRVLADVDLAVAPGTVLALLGRNGAGKTTTIRILSTLTRPDRGLARVAGFDVV